MSYIEQIKMEYKAIRTIRETYGRWKIDKERKRTLQVQLEKHTLPWEICKSIRTFICPDIIPEEIKEWPKATNGKSATYFPRDLPIVIKTGSWKSPEERFQIIQIARNLCERENYSLLTIPRARVCGQFIIEEKVPIQYFSHKEQVSLYIKNRDLFTSCVKEFVDFLCHSVCTDVTTGAFSDSTWQGISPVPVGRYDNFALYLEDGIGKMALIDLEHWSESKKNTQSIGPYLDAITLFPLHFDDIIDIARENGAPIEAFLPRLRERKDKLLELFQILHVDHANFLQTKGIHQEFTLSEITQQKVREKLITLLETTSGKPIPQEPIDHFIEMVTRFLSEEIGQKSVSSDIELLNLRSLKLSATPQINLHSRTYEDMNPWTTLVNDLLEVLDIEENPIRPVTECLFQTLVAQQEISYFGWGHPNKYFHLFC